MMCSEDLRNYGDAFDFLVVEVIVGGEVVRCRSPEGVPPTGQTGCSHGRLGGEEGDYDVQHVFGEAADEVKLKAFPRRLRFWLDPPPLVGRLILHLSQCHRQPENLLRERGIWGGGLGARTG
jgi:hypothetical protein